MFGAGLPNHWAHNFIFQIQLEIRNKRKRIKEPNGAYMLSQHLYTRSANGRLNYVPTEIKVPAFTNQKIW